MLRAAGHLHQPAARRRRPVDHQIRRALLHLLQIRTRHRRDRIGRHDAFRTRACCLAARRQRGVEQLQHLGARATPPPRQMVHLLRRGTRPRQPLHGAAHRRAGVRHAAGRLPRPRHALHRRQPRRQDGQHLGHRHDDLRTPGRALCRMVRLGAPARYRRHRPAALHRPHGIADPDRAAHPALTTRPAVGTGRPHRPAGRPVSTAARRRPLHRLLHARLVVAPLQARAAAPAHPRQRPAESRIMDQERPHLHRQRPHTRRRPRQFHHLA